MSSNWATIEDAIFSWVVAGSGLGNSKVIWSNGEGPRPEAPYIAMRGQVAHVGRPWSVVRDADHPAPGQEIVRTSYSVKRLSLQLQCFGGANTGLTSPAFVLSNLVDYSGLPTQREAFVAGGWAPSVFEPILDLSGVQNGAFFEPRAVLNCYGFITGEVAEAGTYIELATIENQITSETFEVDSTP